MVMVNCAKMYIYVSTLKKYGACACTCTNLEVLT